MKRPNTRAEFERAFHLLHQQMEDGKFHTCQGISLDGLMRVRFLPNGRIDFLSVNESARLLANSTAHFSDSIFQEQLNETELPEAKAADKMNSKTKS